MEERNGSANLVRGSFYMMAAGEAMGLAAAIPGIVDWLSIREDHRSRQIGAWHMGLNVLMLVMRGVVHALFLVGVRMEVAPAVAVLMRVQVDPPAAQAAKHVDAERDQHHADDRLEHTASGG